MKFHVSRNNHNNELHQVWKSACLSQNQRVYITSWLCALSPYLSQERDIRSSMPSRNCDLHRSLSHRCYGNRIINMDNFWEMYNTSTILTLLNGEVREMEKNLNMWQLSAECCEEYIKQKKRFLQLFQSSWQGFLKKLKRLPSKVFF